MVLSCGEKASLLVSLAVTNPYYSTYQLYTVYDPLCKYTSQTHIIFCFHDFVCSCIISTEEIYVMMYVN